LACTSPEHLGRSGDEGVDGALNQDALGLDRIYAVLELDSTTAPTATYE
jgi:restriction endonuclease Mrr